MLGNTMQWAAEHMPREQVSPSNNPLQKDRYTAEGAAQHAWPLPEEKRSWQTEQLKGPRQLGEGRWMCCSLQNMHTDSELYWLAQLHRWKYQDYRQYFVYRQESDKDLMSLHYVCRVGKLVQTLYTRSASNLWGKTWLLVWPQQSPLHMYIGGE